MKIHEYQGHALFKQYGIPVTEAALAGDPAEAVRVADAIGYPVVVKAQVLVGGRGKAGGVRVAGDPAETMTTAEQILALTIKSIPVRKVLVAQAVEPLREYYVGLTVDRSNKAIALMVSAAGGVDIEELAASEPEKILRMEINPAAGLNEHALRRMLEQAFDSDGGLVEQALDAIGKLYRLFIDKDCSLVEINPYALLDDGRLLALDAKINFDDNALSKHPDVEEMRSPDEYSGDEIRARDAGLSFVSMDGDIGCIVNGAGLAMATMDLIKYFGGEPANFLDVGGSSNPQKVLDALSIILGNEKVKAILINIFGGITRCDDIAQGILLARSRIDIRVPVVIRLIGTNDMEGRRILTNAGLSATESLTEAVQQVVAAGKGA